MVDPSVLSARVLDVVAMIGSGPYTLQADMLHWLGLKVISINQPELISCTHFSSRRHSRRQLALARQRTLVARGPREIGQQTGTNGQYEEVRSQRGRHCTTGSGRWRSRMAVSLELRLALLVTPAVLLTSAYYVISWLDTGTECCHLERECTKRGRGDLQACQRILC